MLPSFAAVTRHRQQQDCLAGLHVLLHVAFSEVWRKERSLATKKPAFPRGKRGLVLVA